MNKRSRQRNKERNKYAILKNKVNSVTNSLDPLDIPNCSGSLVRDEFNFLGYDQANYVEKMALYKRQRIERGFDDTEIWNLYRTLAKYILPRLVEFRKVMNGYPANVGSFEEYEAIVDKMIYAFDYLVNEEDYTERLEKEMNIDWKGWIKTVKLPDGNYELVHTEKYDKELMDKYHKAQGEVSNKVSEGLRLFGEFFNTLWW